MKIAKLPKNKKLKQIFFISAGLLIIGILVFFSVDKNGKNTNIVQENTEQYVQLEKDTMTMMSKGDYQAAITANESAYNTAKTEFSRAKLAYEIGKAYSSDRKFDQSKIWLNRANDHYSAVSDHQEEVQYAKTNITTELESIQINENVKPFKQDIKGEDNAL